MSFATHVPHPVLGLYEERLEEFASAQDAMAQQVEFDHLRLSRQVRETVYRRNMLLISAMLVELNNHPQANQDIARLLINGQKFPLWKQTLYVSNLLPSPDGTFDRKESKSITLSVVNVNDRLKLVDNVKTGWYVDAKLEKGRQPDYCALFEAYAEQVRQLTEPTRLVEVLFSLRQSGSKSFALNALTYN